MQTRVRMMTSDSETHDMVPGTAHSPNSKRRGGPKPEKSERGGGGGLDTPMVKLKLEEPFDSRWEAGSMTMSCIGLSDTPSDESSFKSAFSFSSGESEPNMDNLSVTVVTDGSKTPSWSVGIEVGLTRYGSGRPVLLRQNANTHPQSRLGEKQGVLLQNSGGGLSTIRARLSRRRLEEERTRVMKEKDTSGAEDIKMKRLQFRERLARRREERREEHGRTGRTNPSGGQQVNLDDLPLADWSGVSDSPPTTGDHRQPILLENADWFEAEEVSDVGQPHGASDSEMTEESVDLSLPAFLVEMDAEREPTEDDSEEAGYKLSPGPAQRSRRISRALRAAGLSHRRADPETRIHSTRADYNFRLCPDVLRKFEQDFGS